jgi:hypothetical protein
LIPQGPLRAFVGRAEFPPLSSFKESFCNRICGLALRSIRDGYRNGYGNGYGNGCGCSFMSVDEIPDLFAFLLSNGYVIDTQLTKMLNKEQFQSSEREIICFFSYEQIDKTKNK